MANILVLDDVLDAANLIRRILEKKGYNAYIFTDEADALEHARRNKVDLAILDIKLKKMSGVEVLRELKEIAPTIQAIMLTAYPCSETEQEALRLGASEYCIKPIETSELEEKVDALIGTKNSLSNTS